jgi:branched-chain amino acid transport system permease protein
LNLSKCYFSIYVFKGVIQGAIYALIALGLTLVYGLLRILHVAHAALFTLGGYIGVIVTNGSGSFLLALTDRNAYRGRCGNEQLYNNLQAVAKQNAIDSSHSFNWYLYRLGGIVSNFFWCLRPFLCQSSITRSDRNFYREFSLSHARILVVVLAIGLLSGVGWLAINTRVGIAARATVIDPQMAASSGINVEIIRYGSFFIGSAFAGAAGVMVSLLNNLVEPTMGAVPSYKALAIIVLGGLGSVRGALVASLALGIIESFGTIYIGHLLDRDSIAFAFLIMVLMVRPQGLLARG